VNKVTLQGVTIGTVVTVISSVFMIIFHKSLPIEVVALLPAVVAAVAHYFGINFAMTRAALKEIKQDQPEQAPVVN
jgi:hypothetical protein